MTVTRATVVVGMILFVAACGGRSLPTPTDGGDGGPIDASDGGVPDAPPPARAKSCTGGAGADLACGAEARDCCESRYVPGGKFLRVYDGLDNNADTWPATVSAFYLDSFEVTVGRFRAFVQAYPGSKPQLGAGAHPKVSGSGWTGAWPLAADGTALVAGLEDGACVDLNGTPLRTWTPAPGANERLPMMCLTWFEAFAFCAWDGGRLPTLAELNFAQAGGSEQRVYPWTTVRDYSAIDPSRAVYHGQAPFPSTPLAVGAKPLGASRWGHLDLSGNVGEVTMDRGGVLDATCNDCVHAGSPNDAVNVLGGSWGSVAKSVAVGSVTGLGAGERSSFSGVRCLRDVP